MIFLNSGLGDLYDIVYIQPILQKYDLYKKTHQIQFLQTFSPPTFKRLKPFITQIRIHHEVSVKIY